MTSTPDHLSADIAAVWLEIISAHGDGDKIVGPSLEAYCGQVARLREAQKRLSIEGLVIANPKGDPIPHPAIAIERVAQDEIRKWGDKFRRRR